VLGLKTRIWVPACAVIITMAFSSTAAAQDTRAEEIAQRQREKAAELAPYQPNRFERVMDRLEQNFADPPSGFYPAIGRVYAGGGLSLGAGYRRFFARQAVWDITGLYSAKNYKLLEIGMRTPWTLDGRVTLEARAGWFDAPQVGYYGLGMDNTRLDRANFQLSQGYVAGTARVRPTRVTRLEGELALEANATDRGRGRYPSIETRYDAAGAPGLFADPTYIRGRATAAIDWRTAPAYSRTGGYYGLSLNDYSDRNGPFSFRRFDAEAIQHLPLLRENWVISVRGRVETLLDDDDVVPHFLLPALGGGRTLRGYSTGRFRDRHSILTSAEFRWIPNRLALDMALFYDAGKVTGRRGDLDFSGLETNWGVGARFHGPTATVLRIEAARGAEGWRAVIATNAAF
jgi:outer membrane translocation and assembly module TamA